MAHQHYRQWSHAESSPTSSLQNPSAAMSRPDIRNIETVSTDPGDRRDRSKQTMKAVRNLALALTLALVGATSFADPSHAQEQALAPATTGVLVIVTVKAGVTRERVMATMSAEIQQTVQLYLNGKIREWYSRSDGRGVVLLLDTRDVAEAHAIMNGLPLGKEDLVDDEFIAVGPLTPLRMLTARP
jgi:hypothetical protein